VNCGELHAPTGRRPEYAIPLPNLRDRKSRGLHKGYVGNRKPTPHPDHRLTAAARVSC
jgi:hypothetical protein